MLDNYRITDVDTLEAIKQALLATYFKNYDQQFLKTEAGKLDIEANVSKRYESALDHVLPWVGKHIDFSGKVVIEIGCGTGSSTAAFSHFVREIHGYDVDDASVVGARERLKILGKSNAFLHTIKAEELTEVLEKNHSAGVDVILLFAVLEHQTIQERNETLQMCWKLLAKNGLLVVVETPNLLIYQDHHTSLLPFMQMLPTRLYAKYAHVSPRDGFNSCFADNEKMSSDEIELRVSRWGRGVSYHDFELVLGSDYANYLVADGFEEEILSWFHVSVEEELLRHFVEKNEIPIPKGFTRSVLNLIFKKDNKGEGVVSKAPQNVHVVEFEKFWELQRQKQVLEALLQQKEQVISEIFNSRRWQVMNGPASLYHQVKKLFYRKEG